MFSWAYPGILRGRRGSAARLLEASPRLKGAFEGSTLLLQDIDFDEAHAGVSSRVAELARTRLAERL